MFVTDPGSVLTNQRSSFTSQGQPSLQPGQEDSTFFNGNMVWKRMELVDLYHSHVKRKNMTCVDLCLMYHNYVKGKIDQSIEGNGWRYECSYLLYSCSGEKINLVGRS